MQGLPVFYLLMSVALPALLLMAIEANRAGAAGLLAWYTFFAAILRVDPPETSQPWLCPRPFTNLVRAEMQRSSDQEFICYPTVYTQVDNTKLEKLPAMPDVRVWSCRFES